MKIYLDDACLSDLIGVSPRRLLDLQREMSADEQVSERLLDQALARGVTGLICTVASPFMRLLIKQPARWPLEIFLVVPDFQSFVRDTSHYGTAGAGLRRVKRMSWGMKIRLGLLALRNFHRLLRFEYSVLTNFLLFAEVANFFSGPASHLKIKAVFLHPKLVDLSTALSQIKTFQFFQQMIQTWFHSEAGLVTRNPVALQSLGGGSQPLFQWILMPFNRFGYLMNPDQKACESFMVQIRAHAHALAAAADPLSFPDQPEDLAYAGRHGLEGIVVSPLSLLDAAIQKSPR